MSFEWGRAGFDGLGHLLAAWSAWASVGICAGTHRGPGRGVGSQVNIARLCASMPSIFSPVRCWEVKAPSVTWSSPCVARSCREAKASKPQGQGKMAQSHLSLFPSLMLPAVNYYPLAKMRFKNICGRECLLDKSDLDGAGWVNEGIMKIFHYFTS